ncbi:MAG: leucine-rich repeat protein [Lachnospiraceae bacterium]|nr:leucine-rich repeat protein [Lachnospiraceae bacterium]
MRKRWGMRVVSTLLIAVMLCSQMQVGVWADLNENSVGDEYDKASVADGNLSSQEEQCVKESDQNDENEIVSEKDSNENSPVISDWEETSQNEIEDHETKEAEEQLDESVSEENENLGNPYQWGTGGVQARINSIYATYSQDGYFSTDGTACGHAQLATCYKCTLSNIDAEAARVCGDAYTCAGFARYVFYHLFGMKPHETGNIKTECYSSEINSKAYLGDFVACLENDGSEPHAGIYLGGSGNTFYLYESNYGQANKVNYSNSHPTTDWPRYRIFHASNYDVINNSSTPIDPPIPQTVISNGVLISYNVTSETVTIPDGVKKIAKGCFNESSKNSPDDIYIKYINFPNTLTEIEEGAFYQCRHLSSVNLPDSVKTLHSKAFESCTINKLRIPAGVTVKTKTTYEGQEWFDGPFYATGIQQIVWADGINKVPDYLFSGSELYMDTITLPNTVTEIGIMAFRVFNSKSMKHIVLPANLSKIGKRAFYQCARLEDLTIPSKITTIPEMCFSYCGIKTLTIPSNVKVIENYAFEYCELESITFPSTTITLHSLSFRSTKIQSFTLSENILLGLDSNNYASSPFTDCELLKTINFTSGCRKIPDYMFSGCDSLESITVPGQITSIGKCAFQSCSGLVTVKIGNGVTTIGERAFNSCMMLEQIAFGNSLTSIGESAFDYCISLEEIHLPNKVTELGESAFRDCTYLKTAELGNSLKKIPTSAFYGCSSLTYVDIPDTVTEIENVAFEDCDSLTEVYYPANIKRIGPYAFSNCTNLRRVIMPDSLEELGEGCYSDCNSLKTIMFSNKLKTIPDRVFDGCNSLKEVRIPDTVTKLGTYSPVFGYCSNLEKVVIPKSVKEISYLAFFESPRCVIYCEAGSYAERYSNSRGIPFAYVTEPNVITAIKVTPSSGKVSLYEGEICMVSFTTDAGYVPVSNLVIQNDAEAVFSHIYNGEGSIFLKGKAEGEGTLTISVNEIQATVQVNVVKPLLQFKDQDGSDMELETMEVVYGEKYPVLPIPEKEGHDFVGWFTQGNLQGIKITQDSIFRGSNVLHAGWIENDEMIRILPQQEYEYTGSMIKPEPIVYSGLTLLTEGKDYSITYQNTTNAGDGDSNKPPTIIIKGKGDYTKSSSLNFSILPKELGSGTEFADDFTVSIGDKLYNGKEQVSKPTIKYGKTTLRENVDYTLLYQGDRVAPGNVTVTVIGKTGGNFTGSAKVSYTIFDKGKGLSEAFVAAIPDQIYTGQAIDLADLPITVKESKKSEETLVRGEDYDVFFASGTNKVNAGTVSILIQGKGNYCGTKTASVKIIPAKLTQGMIAVENAVYNGAQAKPAVTVTLGGEVVDPANYTLTYKNNTKVGLPTAGRKAPMVTVKGKGNLSGSIDASFTIAPRVLTQADLSISIPDIKDNGSYISDKAVKPSIQCEDPLTHKMITLKNGTDYDVAFIRTFVKETQTANIYLKGNYESEENITAKFRIYGAQTTLAQDDVEVQGGIPVYSGEKITLPIVVKTTVDGEEKTLVEGKDYTVSYTNNTNAANKDTASKKPTWKVTGKGAYKGTVSGFFTIAKREFASEDFTVTVADVKNNGNDQKPKFTVVNNATGKALKSSDYTVAYGSTKTSTDDAQLTITGQGNYDGTLTGHFRVYDKSITSAVFEKIENMPYTGKQITPSGDHVIIYADKSAKNALSPLQEGVDYTLTYGENVKAGSGTVTVTGIGSYGGSKTLKFTIVPKWLQWLL